MVNSKQDQPVNVLYHDGLPSHWQDLRSRLSQFQERYFQKGPSSIGPTLAHFLELSEAFLEIEKHSNPLLNFLATHDPTRVDSTRSSWCEWASCESSTLPEALFERARSTEAQTEVTPMMSVLAIDANDGFFMMDPEAGEDQHHPVQGLVLHWKNWWPCFFDPQRPRVGWEEFQKTWGSELPLLGVNALHSKYEGLDSGHQFKLWAGRPEQGWLIEFNQYKATHHPFYDRIHDITLRLIAPGLLNFIWDMDMGRLQQESRRFTRDWQRWQALEASQEWPGPAGACQEYWLNWLEALPSQAQEVIQSWVLKKYLAHQWEESSEDPPHHKKRL